ncbi:hypothetical protein HYX12_02175 [Candidatus Woesearchaeota archaeon]|nr:hypothetical protein [Candidatus Woesearchaeota archaeon]
MAEPDYLGTTSLALDHYFGNCTGCFTGVVGVRYRATNHDFGPSRDKFIAGLERAIEKNVPETEGVTLDNLREIVDLARHDWSDLDAVKKLYQRGWELRPKRYPHPKDMFPYEGQ